MSSLIEESCFQKFSTEHFPFPICPSHHIQPIRFHLHSNPTLQLLHPYWADQPESLPSRRSPTSPESPSSSNDLLGLILLPLGLSLPTPSCCRTLNLPLSSAHTGVRLLSTLCCLLPLLVRAMIGTPIESLRSRFCPPGVSGVRPVIVSPLMLLSLPLLSKLSSRGLCTTPCCASITIGVSSWLFESK
jgi:hypothetical protein